LPVLFVTGILLEGDDGVAVLVAVLLVAAARVVEELKTVLRKEEERPIGGENAAETSATQSTDTRTNVIVSTTRTVDRLGLRIAAIILFVGVIIDDPCDVISVCELASLCKCE
jgi:hypothetical protein